MEGLKNGTRAPFFPLEADQLQDRCKMDSDPCSREVNGTDFGGREANTHGEVWLGGFLFGVGTSLKKHDTGKEQAAGQARAGFMSRPGAQETNCRPFATLSTHEGRVSNFVIRLPRSLRRRR